MSDGDERAEGPDPWAPPERRVPLEKPRPEPAPAHWAHPDASRPDAGRRDRTLPDQTLPDPARADQVPARPTRPGPPSVADQQTLASMPPPTGRPGMSSPQAPPGVPHQAPGPFQSFAPPAASAVPPPPIAPNGPGPAAYGGGPYGADPYAGYASGPVPAVPPGYGYGCPGGPLPGPGGWSPAPPTSPANGLGTAGMVLAIIGACLVVTVVGSAVAIILGILAVIFGAVGRSKAARGEATNAGQALTGVILGSVTVVAGILVLTLLILGLVSDLDSYDEPYDDTYNALVTSGAGVLTPAEPGHSC